MYVGPNSVLEEARREKVTVEQRWKAAIGLLLD